MITDWSEARAHDPAEPVDDRADLAALGAIAYHAMTGTEPDLTAYEPVHDRCPLAPAELCEIIDRLLAVDPDERPTAAEVRAELAWSHSIATPRADTHRDLAQARDDLEVEIEMVDIDVDSIPISAPDPASAPMIRIRRPRWEW